MSYKQLFVWLFCLIVSIFTGCVPLILSIASIPTKMILTEREPKVKMKDYSRPVKGRHPDALEKSHRREWIDNSNIQKCNQKGVVFK